MGRDKGDRPDAGESGLPQFAGALEPIPGGRLAEYLGYPTSPYECVAVKDLAEEMKEMLQAAVFEMFRGQKRGERIGNAIEAARMATGLPEELVTVAATMIAFAQVARYFPLNPPNEKALKTVNRDSLRMFRAYLWDLADIGERIQRKELDTFRDAEITRRRS